MVDQYENSGLGIPLSTSVGEYAVMTYGVGLMGGFVISSETIRKTQEAEEARQKDKNDKPPKPPRRPNARIGRAAIQGAS